jgi:hypothetical protein
MEVEICPPCLTIPNRSRSCTRVAVVARNECNNDLFAV